MKYGNKSLRSVSPGFEVESSIVRYLASARVGDTASSSPFAKGSDGYHIASLENSFATRNCSRDPVVIATGEWYTFGPIEEVSALVFGSFAAVDRGAVGRGAVGGTSVATCDAPT